MKTTSFPDSHIQYYLQTVHTQTHTPERRYTTYMEPKMFTQFELLLIHQSFNLSFWIFTQNSWICSRTSYLFVRKNDGFETIIYAVLSKYSRISSELRASRNSVTSACILLPFSSDCLSQRNYKQLLFHCNLFGSQITCSASKQYNNRHIKIINTRYDIPENCLSFMFFLVWMERFYDNNSLIFPENS